MTNTKQIETRVVVALASVLASYVAPQGLPNVHARRLAMEAIAKVATPEIDDAVAALVDIASALDDLGQSQALDAKQLSASLAQYAARVEANPTAAISNPATSSLITSLTERAVRIQEKTQQFATLARIALGNEKAMAVSKALTTG